MTWRPLQKAARFENAVKSGAFSKRYGIICHANSKTISIWVRREICILQFKIMNLAWSLALCFSSLKRSKLSLYFLWTDSQSTPSAVLLTLYSYSSHFLRNSTTLWTEMYFSLWWEKQHSRFFLTQIPLVCDDFSMAQTVWKLFCANTFKPHRFWCGFRNRETVLISNRSRYVNAAWENMIENSSKNMKVAQSNAMSRACK